MTDEEIEKAANQIQDHIDGMTGNERLYNSGLMSEFELAKKTDKAKARQILELLRFDTWAIDKIL